MSQRSQRIGGTFHSYQSEDTGNSRISGGSSLLSGPQLISCAPHTTYYYSKSVINEAYLTDDRGFSLKTNVAFDEPLESSSYWSEELSLRRRRGTQGIKSNKKINGLGDRKTYDTYGSSSGSSSEDDYTGGSSMDQNTSSFGFKSVVSKVGSFFGWCFQPQDGSSVCYTGGWGPCEKNTEGATLSHEVILVLLDKLMTQQKAVMREKLGSDIDLHLQNKLDVFRSQVQKDFESLLKKEIDKLEEHLSNLKKEFVTLGSDQKALSRQVESLPGQIKEIEDKTGKPFVQHEELQEQLCKLKHKVLAKILKNQELSVQDVEITLHKEGITGLTEEQIHHIVNDALKHYSEDLIGMVDYVLESGRASVISTWCSETYETWKS
ncbi:SUN domain-containing protein 2, partial [Ophiophagus hannah]